MKNTAGGVQKPKASLGLQKHLSRTSSAEPEEFDDDDDDDEYMQSASLVQLNDFVVFCRLLQGKRLPKW